MPKEENSSWVDLLMTEQESHGLGPRQQLPVGVRTAAPPVLGLQPPCRCTGEAPLRLHATQSPNPCLLPPEPAPHPKGPPLPQHLGAFSIGIPNGETLRVLLDLRTDSGSGPIPSGFGT